MNLGFLNKERKKRKKKKNQTGKLAFWAPRLFKLKKTSMLLVLMIQKIGWEGIRNAKYIDIYIRSQKGGYIE